MNTLPFNFSHDLALARNTLHYTPPPNVQLMERDLAPLVRLLPPAPLRYDALAPIWGWNKAFVRKLHCQGVEGLPTEEQLATIRDLSSRRTAIEMLPALRSQLPAHLTAGESVMLTREEDIVADITTRFFSLTDGSARTLILKAPYSGSGRGLRLVSGQLSDQQLHWAQRCVREQGGVVVEPYYDKVLDFALEFLVVPNGVDYLGLSLFTTNENNVYAGNIIAPQKVLQQKLINLLPNLDFEEFINILLSEIDLRFTGRYLGPVGVDMMVVNTAETASLPLDFAINGVETAPLLLNSETKQPSRRLHPCVEVNVRRTMGELSLHLLPLMADGTEGFFHLLFDKSPATLAQRVAAMPQPVYDAAHRLVSGTHLLTPIAPDHQTTHYVALLETI